MKKDQYRKCVVDINCQKTNRYWSEDEFLFHGIANGEIPMAIIERTQTGTFKYDEKGTIELYPMEHIKFID